MSKHAVRGGDVARLLERFAQLRKKALARTGKVFPFVVIQEAGLDGFWIDRVLRKEGIESHVVDPASIPLRAQDQEWRGKLLRDIVASIARRQKENSYRQSKEASCDAQKGCKTWEATLQAFSQSLKTWEAKRPAFAQESGKARNTEQAATEDRCKNGTEEAAKTKGGGR